MVQLLGFLLILAVMGYWVYLTILKHNENSDDYKSVQDLRVKIGSDISDHFRTNSVIQFQELLLLTMKEGLTSNCEVTLIPKDNDWIIEISRGKYKEKVVVSASVVINSESQENKNV